MRVSLECLSTLPQVDSVYLRMWRSKPPRRESAREKRRPLPSWCSGGGIDHQLAVHLNAYTQKATAELHLEPFKPAESVSCVILAKCQVLSV